MTSSEEASRTGPSAHGTDILNQATESFLARVRRGETPSVSEYTQRYPEVADRIRELFPTLALVERIGDQHGLAPSTLTVDVSRRLGDYVLLRRIASGGMGVVYEAYQITLGRHVALKILGEHLAGDAGALRRFRREAQSAAQLHHTNIVPVYDVGVVEGTHYYSMQYIAGESLDKVWRQLSRMRESGDQGENEDLAGSLANGLLTWVGSTTAPLGRVTDGPARGRRERTCLESRPAAEAPIVAGRAATSLEASSADSSSGARFLSESPSASFVSTRRNYFRNVASMTLQVLDAVAHAHQRGLLHRDIKPSNIILDTHGRAWVTDFGLATDGSRDLTQTGDIVGTLRYMSPERFNGVADERSDIYGVGLTLYEFLTLRPALPSTDNARLVHQIQQAAIVPPTSIEPQLPRDLETIVRKAIDKEPDRRYASAEAFAADLRRFLADRPIAARRTNWNKRAWLWCRRNPVVASLTTAVAVLLIGIAAVAIAAAVVARENARRLTAEKDRVEAAELKARSRLFESYQNEAKAVRWSGRPGRRFDSLRAIRGATELLPSLGFSSDERAEEIIDLRNHAVAALSLADLQLAETWTPPERTAFYAFDAALRRYAQSDLDGLITIRDLATGRELARLPGPDLPAWGIRYSPDGRYLAARYEGAGVAARLKVWDLKTGDAILEVDPVVRDNSVDFSPDEREIAIARPNGLIEFHDLATGEMTASLPCGPSPRCLRYDPDGRRLAWGSFAETAEGSDVTIWDLRDRTSEQLSHDDAVRWIAWNQTAGEIAAASDRFVHVWDLASGGRKSVLGPFPQKVQRVEYSHAGHVLALCTWKHTYLYDLNTGEEELVTEGMCGHFSPNGSHLGYRSGSTIGRWRVALGTECHRLPRNDVAFGLSSQEVNVGGHSVYLLAAAGREAVEVYDSTAVRKVATLPGASMSAHFLPAGSALMTSGMGGLLRWPIRQGAAESRQATLSIGPPRSLVEHCAGRASIDQRGDRIVLDVGDHARIARISDLTDDLRAVFHPRLDFVGMSPSGRWAATGTWSGRGVKVWETGSGRLVADLLPDCSHAKVFFHPREECLVVASGYEYCVFEATTWRMMKRVARSASGGEPGAAAFSEEGDLVAIASSMSQVSLLTADDWMDVARFDAPGAVGCLEFCGEGNCLAAVTRDDLLVWDLSSLRRQLGEMGLDWQTGQRRGEVRPPAPKPFNVVVDPGTLRPGHGKNGVQAHQSALRAMREQTAGDWNAAIDSYRDAIALEPRHAESHNYLAWILATCPDEGLRDPECAARHARQAVEWAPWAAENWNTLGVALYRVSDFAGAAEALMKSQDLEPNRYRGHNGFFLAMALWRLGNEEAARSLFDELVSWMDANRAKDEELQRFRSEAANILGVLPGSLSTARERTEAPIGSPAR